jgi:hypothetical protein
LKFILGKSNSWRIVKNSTDVLQTGDEAMLYCLKAYWGNSGFNDLTDVLSGDEYWKGTDEPADSAFENIGLKPLKK